VPGESGGIGQQRREPLHPPVDRHVVDLDATITWRYDRQVSAIPA
jgi:hypothetical protein